MNQCLKKNPIPERLKEARYRAGLSQRSLGLLVGFDPASASSRMNHYEKGRHRHVPDIDTLRRMAAELNVPLNYFFCDDQTTAELALLISRMTEEERSNLIEALKTSSGVKHADKK
jgi:transcriptional regulator with XRE-family HTH domain